MFYTLENNQLKIKVTTLGATLASFIDKTTGTDIVLGFETEEKYLKYSPYMGATVGRCANRIKNGQFELNNQSYQVTVNNGPNSLHGGTGISFKEFEVIEKN